MSGQNESEIEVQRAMRAIAGWFGCADEAKGRTPDELGRFLYERERTAAWQFAQHVREITEKRLAGSAETGGEKAAPKPGTAEYYARQTGEVLASGSYSNRAFEIALEIRRGGATVPRSSQNQTVSSGVEGAHEGTTVDRSVLICGECGEPSTHPWCQHCKEFTCLAESREPEKLNNAQTHEAGCPDAGTSHLDHCECPVALAESSLGSPPPTSDLSAPKTPAPLSTQLDTTKEKQ